MDEARISIKVQPRASRTELVGFQDGVWRIRVAAPPERGKANAELAAYLARVLDVSRRDIIIARGTTSRNKLILVRGLNGPEVEARLSHALRGR
jgi:hypothetical protein